jgi:lactoylglutathione lyase
MPTSLVHTCLRVRDIDASMRFYRALGFDERGRLNFESAYNVYMGLPDDGDRLELTVNVGREEPYELGDGYNHFAVTVDNIEDALARLAELGVEPEKPPYHPGGREELPLIAFAADPDGYRVELTGPASVVTGSPPAPAATKPPARFSGYGAM